MLNKTVNQYLEKNTQYKTRKDTDCLFPFEMDFDYFGIMDDTARFVQDGQLKETVYWKAFVDQFRDGQVDTKLRAWRGEYWGKMMRGASITYQYTLDEELYNVLEDTVKDMLTTQDEHGRFSTYSIDDELYGWDMWARKYVMLGFLHFHEICNDEKLKTKIVESLKKHLDYIIAHVGEGSDKKDIRDTSYNYGAINSSSILEPVVRFYNLTGEKKYLDFASYIVSSGACKLGNIFELAYENKLLPHEYPVQKAYEMMSCFEGLIEYYRVTKIDKWKIATENFVNAIIKSEITVAGGSGCRNEFFNNSVVSQTYTEYKGNMQETCVTVTWMKLCMQLLCLTGKSQYADEIEKSIFNALYGSVNTEKSPKNGGLMFDSYSPLLKNHRGLGIGGLQTLNAIYIYGCCTAIGAAGTGIAPKYTVMHSKDGITFNCYQDGMVSGFTPKNQPVTFEVDTLYPVEDDVQLTLSIDEAEEFEISLRIPYFVKGASVRVNGEEIPVKAGSFATIKRVWNSDDVIEIHFDVEAEIIKALPNPEDENSKKHFAIKRGALLLARDSKITDDVGEPITFDKKVFLKRVNTLNADAQCQYIVSTDKGDATLMVDYASTGKSLNEDHMIECWFKTEEY